MKAEKHLLKKEESVVVKNLKNIKSKYVDLEAEESDHISTRQDKEPSIAEDSDASYDSDFVVKDKFQNNKGILRIERKFNEQAQEDDKKAVREVVYGRKRRFNELKMYAEDDMCLNNRKKLKLQENTLFNDKDKEKLSLELIYNLKQKFEKIKEKEEEGIAPYSEGEENAIAKLIKEKSSTLITQLEMNSSAYKKEFLERQKETQETLNIVVDLKLKPQKKNRLTYNKFSLLEAFKSDKHFIEQKNNSTQECDFILHQNKNKATLSNFVFNKNPIKVKEETLYKINKVFK